MQIDWITVSAQIINFLVLVWLLKRFLYKPVIGAMERREQRIAERLDQAQQKKKDAEQREQQYREKTGELEQRRESLLEEAREEAEKERDKLLQDARDAAEEKRRKWMRQVEEEKRSFLDQLEQRAADAIQSVAARALGDLGSRELEEAMVSRLLEQLDSIERADAEALAGEGGGVEVVSAGELESATRSRLTRAIHSHFGKELEVSYGTAPELLCGIAIRSGGRRLGWNLSDYLDALRESMDDMLDKVAARRAKDDETDAARNAG